MNRWAAPRLATPGLAALALWIGFSPLGMAAPTRWNIEPGTADSEVVFASKAPMESFEGRTKQVSGYIVLDPEALSDSVEVSIEVDLASLDTGIALRNQHMRENHLDAKAYPKAIFRGARLHGFPPRLLRGETARGRAMGIFDLHGVVRPITVDVSLAVGIDGSLAVGATFEVYLADHEIERPKFLVLKLDEKQEITVDLLALPVRPRPSKEGSPE